MLDTLFNANLLTNELSYFFIFLLSTLESIPIIGLLLPGNFVILTAGFLSKTQENLNITLVILISIAGYLTGGITTFLIAKHFGDALLYKLSKKYNFSLKMYENIKAKISNHSGKIIIFGKSNSASRGISAYAVATTNINFRTFLGFEIISSIIWGSFYPLLGYLSGSLYLKVSKYVNTGILVVFIGIPLIYYTYTSIKKTINTLKKGS